MHDNTAAAATAQSGTHRCQAASGLLLAHIALGDVLLEGGEECPEERHMVAEQTGLCNAAGVQAAEQDLAATPAAVHLAHGEHVAHLQGGERWRGTASMCSGCEEVRNSSGAWQPA